MATIVQIGNLFAIKRVTAAGEVQYWSTSCVWHYSVQKCMLYRLRSEAQFQIDQFCFTR